MSVIHRIFTVLSILVIALAGCGGPQSSSPEEQPTGPLVNWETIDSCDFNVAEADFDLAIPAKHLYEWIYFSRVASAGGWVEDSTLEYFRDSVLIDTLVGLTSLDFDLTSLWHRHREYLRQNNAVLRQAFWDKHVSSLVVIDSQAVVDFYSENPDNFTLPEQANMYHILSSYLGFLQGPDSALLRGYDREDLVNFGREYIHRLHQLLMYGEAFENVAFNFSHDVLSREKGGHLGWTVKEKYIDPFDSVAFSLEDGEFSEPYRDADGWHILYRTGYNPGGTQPLDTGWVYARAQQSVFDAEAGRLAAGVLDSLQSDTRIVENPRILTDTIIYNFPDSAWAAIVNETDTIDVLELKGYEDSFRRGYGVGNTTPEMRSSMIKQASMPVRVQIAARADGMDTLPVHREMRLRTWREAAKAHVISDLYAFDEWEPTDSAIAAYYEAHFDEYNPEEHIVAQQLIAGELELANFLKGQINLGLDLAYLARYYGDDEGYDVKFEDLGTVSLDKVDSAMYYALQTTHANRTTRVVETERGFQVAKVFERDYARPLEMVKSEVKSILKNQQRWERWASLRDDLFRKHNVRYPGVLPRFELPRLSARNHPRTLPKAVHGGPF